MDTIKAKDLLTIIEEFAAVHGGNTNIGRVPPGWTDAVQAAISQLLDAMLKMTAKIKELEARVAALEADVVLPEEPRQ